MHTYYVSVEGQQRRVDVEALENGKYRVFLDEQARSVDAQYAHGDVLSLLIDDVSYDADIERVPKKKNADDGSLTLNIRVHDDVVAATVHDLRSHNLQALAGTATQVSGKQEVCAPMPGKIVKLLVDKDTKVHVGQGLVVVEAMKMENEIQATSDGTVLEVRVQTGQAVEAGAVMLIVE